MNEEKRKQLKNLVSTLNYEELQILETLITFRRWRLDVQHSENTKRKVEKAYFQNR